MSDTTPVPPSTSWPVPTTLGACVGVAACSLTLFRPPGPLADVLLLGLVAAFVGGFVLALGAGLHRLHIRRTAPHVATKGEAVVLVHEVYNPTLRNLRDVSLIERGPAGRARTFFAVLPAGERSEARTRMFLSTRGPHPLEGLDVWGTDPFGLFSVRRTLPLPATILVRPRPRRAHGRALLARAKVLTGAAPTGAWSGVREYRHGDPLKQVHWPLTAKADLPIVRLVDAEGPASSSLVLDRKLGDHRRASLDFERAIAVAAGVALACLERGGLLRLSAPGHDPLHLHGLRGRAGGDRVLEALALLQPDPHGVDAEPTPPHSIVITSRTHLPRRPGVAVFVVSHDDVHVWRPSHG